MKDNFFDILVLVLGDFKSETPDRPVLGLVLNDEVVQRISEVADRVSVLFFDDPVVLSFNVGSQDDREAMSLVAVGSYVVEEGGNTIVGVLCISLSRQVTTVLSNADLTFFDRNV